MVLWSILLGSRPAPEAGYRDEFLGSIFKSRVYHQSSQYLIKGSGQGLNSEHNLHLTLRTWRRGTSISLHELDVSRTSSPTLSLAYTPLPLTFSRSFNMHLPSFTIALAALCTLVTAGPAQRGGPARSRCYTSMGTRPVPWRKQTSWAFRYTPCTTTISATATITSTPTETEYSTITESTTTTIPASNVTLIYTNTTSASDTATVFTTITSTATTTVSAVSTSTVAAPSVPSPFSPVQTTFEGSSCDSLCGISPNNGTTLTKREPFTPWTNHGFQPSSPNHRNRYYQVSPNPNAPAPRGPHLRGNHTYPQGARCVLYSPLKCSTTTITTTTTSTLTDQTSTLTLPTTTTQTATIVPGSNTTLTLTTTTTDQPQSTSTVLVTTTTTLTTYTATTPLYAACTAPNRASLYTPPSPPNNGSSYAITDINGPWSARLATNATSAYDCCVAAFTFMDNNAQAWIYTPSKGAGGAACFIGVGEMGCADQGQTGGYGAILGTGRNGTQGEVEAGVVGNAICGGVVAVATVLEG